MKLLGNEAKQAIKAIPGVSFAAKVINRTVIYGLKRLKSLPGEQRRNTELNSRISGLMKDPEKRIWYFGVPEHPNLGDQAQRACIYSWLGDSFPDYEIVSVASAEFNGSPSRTCAVLADAVGVDDIIVMQSGHTMDGLHPDERAHRALSRLFPDNRIVFFPTSISFASRWGKNLDIKAINSHERTLFLARDAVSERIARDIYPNVRVERFPDVVTSLIGRYKGASSRNRLLLCTRNDGEKLYSYREIDKLAEMLGGLCGMVSRCDTSIDLSSFSGDVQEIWEAIQETVADYSRYSVVVTDRYHGTIFARIAGTPVVVLKTTDHKVVAGAQWFVDGGDEGIVVANSLEEVPGLVDRMMKRFPEGIAAPSIADPYFDKLHDMITML